MSDFILELISEEIPAKMQAPAMRQLEILTLKKVNENIKLHMVGRLQSNKAKDAIKLFDYIHSLDSQKLADVLAKHQLSLDKKLKYFIQVNIGNEPQKSGIPVNEIDNFYDFCTKERNLNILGLMVIPPNDQSAKKYFQELLKK